MSGEHAEGDMRTLDVREIDGEPFTEIMAHLDSLAGHERLLLINTFEPVPLYDILEQRGFAFETAQEPDGTWHITITVEDT